MTLIGLIVMLFGGFVALFGILGLNRGFQFFLLFMAGCVIAYFGIRLASRNQRQLKKFQEEVSELDEFKNGKYKHMHEDTAISVHPDRKKVFLVNGAAIKFYDFKDIREWGFNIQSGLSDPNNIRQAMDVIKQDAENSRNSVFYLKVRDVDHPSWAIRFSSLGDKKKEMERWQEILTQSINEN